MTETSLTYNASAEANPPVKTDIAYSMITLGSTTVWAVWSGWLLYFYLPPDGTARVPVALFGIATLIASILNAVITPPVGYWSDHTHHRWGRRLPFMAASSLPLLIFFVLMWTPPVPGQSIWNLVYLMVVLGLYNVAYSFLHIPYASLLPDLATTDRHRVRVSAWYAGFMMVAMIVGSFAGPAIESLGYSTAAMIYAAAMLPLFYLPFLVLRERPGRQIAAAERLPFRQSISITLHNPAFLTLTIAWLLYWGVTAFIQAAVPFIVTQICLLSEADTLYFYLPAVLAGLACYPLVTWLTGRFGKWRVFSGSLLASAIVLPMLALIGDWLPVPLMAQGIVWITLEAIAISAVTMLPSAFAAEVTDYDEMLTSQRREGSYYSTWGLLEQVVNGAAMLVLPLLLLLGRSHTDPYGPLGVRLVGVAGGLMLLVAFFVFLRYPLRNWPGLGTKNEPGASGSSEL
jgi:GPH family glycoside/pentoside/hexuronide:cation symporter